MFTFTVKSLVVVSKGARLRTLATAAAAANGKAFSIPVIDFSKFKQARSAAEKQETAEEIVTAFKESGFVYLSNHGIPRDTVQNAFQKACASLPLSKEFFALPPEIKDSLAWEDPRANRGYVQIGRERVTQSSDPDEIAALREKAPDYKESMEIGRDWDSEWKNQWPTESDAPLYKQTMLDFFQTCHNLHVDVMRSIALGLDLGERFFDDKINEQCHNLRLLSYPPIKSSLLEGDGQARAGAHSDYGTLTLLFQDSPGTIVVNIGDLLSRWSNDVLRSTLHRVVAPAGKQVNDKEKVTPHRQSIAFFCNPNFSAEVACLPNCGPHAKYPPVNTGDYIVGRLTATY
ncbi:hypothetical protein MD484_g3991, partial [Candolleomyces efflorescens]